MGLTNRWYVQERGRLRQAWRRLDETSHHHLKETRQPRAARPGALGICDYEYERGCVSNLFMLFAPQEGWRRVEVTERLTRVDWVRVVKQLVDVAYADKERIVLVTGNLNTHRGPALRGI